jgi:DeoR family suf operon transcriptional repressor
MQSTRSEIVEYLNEHGRASVQELTVPTGLTAMTIRHHLAILEDEGLVSREQERGHVGRPRDVYCLTEEARALFPERYDELARHLLNSLKELGATDHIHAVLDRMAAELTAEHSTSLADKSLEERLNLLIDVLGNAGFLATWDHDGPEYVLREYSCPYYAVGQDHPEICRVDWQIINTILDAPVERDSCMLHGDAHCTFHVAGTIDVPLSELS